MFHSPLKSKARHLGSVNEVSVSGHGGPSGLGWCKIVPDIKDESRLFVQNVVEKTVALCCFKIGGFVEVGHLFFLF